MPQTNGYWFPAKRYGWGWGFPIAWQGWAVLVGFIVLLVLAPWIFPPKEERSAFFVYVGGLIAVLLVICYAKGEPPKWRWGDKQ